MKKLHVIIAKGRSEKTNTKMYFASKKKEAKCIVDDLMQNKRNNGKNIIVIKGKIYKDFTI